MEELHAEAHAGAVVAGRLRHSYVKRAGERMRRCSLHSQVVNHLAGETARATTTKASGKATDNTVSRTGSPMASSGPVAAGPSPVMEAVSHLNARQERLEHTLDGLVALMNRMNHRLLAMDDELAKQTETMDPTHTGSPLPPGTVIDLSEQAQP